MERFVKCRKVVFLIVDLFLVLRYLYFVVLCHEWRMVSMASGTFLSYDNIPFDVLEIVRKVINQFVEEEKVECQDRLEPASLFLVLRREGSCYTRYVQISFYCDLVMGCFVFFVPTIVYFNLDSGERKTLTEVPSNLMVKVYFSNRGNVTDAQKVGFECAVKSALNTAWENSYRITPDMLQKLG